MRRAINAMVLGLMALLAAPAGAQPTADPELAPYAQPPILADIGAGRRIGLHCMGAGSPTVILSAGLGNWAETWRKVQPAIAARTRVCAWDRAGFGFSSPSPDPQDVAHTTRDLEGALRAARIAGPLVLVGHSLGGLEMLVFADRNRRRIAGMVLEDPSFPGQFEAFRNRPSLFAANMADERAKAAEIDRCAAQAATHRGEPGAMTPSARRSRPPIPPPWSRPCGPGSPIPPAGRRASRCRVSSSATPRWPSTPVAITATYPSSC